MGRLAPFIAQQVEELCRFKDLQFKVDGFTSGTGEQDEQDRFTVAVPCCSRHVKWHVLYDASRPSGAPDVIFAEGDEAFQPLVPTADGDAAESHSASWAILKDWHPGDGSRLLKLILNLRKLYLEHHWALAETVADPRVKFELSTLTHTPGTEVFVSQSGQWGQRRVDDVHVAVALQPVDLSPLSAFKSFSGFLPSSEGNPSKVSTPPRLALHVRFPVSGSNGSSSSQLPQARLDSPLLLENLLAQVEFKLPQWTDSMCMIEYEPLVKEQLNVKIREAVAGLHSRASFLTAVTSLLGSPLEFDAVMFLRSTVVLTIGNFLLLLHILLSPKFPKVQPSLQLQSAQHFDSNGRPIFSQVFDAYPWSPRWDPPEMVRRIVSFLQEEGTRFKVQCG